MRISTPAKYFCFFSTTFALVFCAAIAVSNLQTKPLPNYLAPLSASPIAQRHPREDKMLATLNAESLDVSIRMLMKDREQYIYTFASSSIVSEDVQQNLEQMLSTAVL